MRIFMAFQARKDPVEYLKRATRAAHRGVKKASSMLARHRSLDFAVFRLSNDSKHSDRS